MKNSKINTLVKIGALSAIAFLLQFLGSVIGLKVGGFLEIEVSDLPAILGAFALGPLAGVAIELIKNLLHCTMTSTGFVGEAANFLVNGVFVLTAGLFYRRFHTRKGAVLGLLVATLTMTAAAMLTNLYLMLPLYMPQAAFSARLSLVLFTITPFNFCRGLALSLITFLIYKRISPLLRRK